MWRARRRRSTPPDSRESSPTAWPWGADAGAMKLTREKATALALLLAVLAFNAWGLRAELHSGGVDLNDNVSHFRMIAGMAQALERGANPLDFWSPEWSFGFPL